jgi:hypothetical protein
MSGPLTSSDRWSLTAFAGLLCLAVLQCASAQSGQCSSIRDPDPLAQYRAQSVGGSGQCSFIRPLDLQAACRSRFG